MLFRSADIIDTVVGRAAITFRTTGLLAPDTPAARVSGVDAMERHFLRIVVTDRPGVLHAVTGVFARNGVSIRAAEQEGIDEDARLVFITHVAKEASVRSTLRELKELDVVRRVGGLLRVIGS